jgi:hypothetical protein
MTFTLSFQYILKVMTGQASKKAGERAVEAYDQGAQVAGQ